MKIRWSNIPIPEQHLAAIIGAAILHIFLPLRVFERPRVGHAVGWPFMLPGVLLAAWAVHEAGVVGVDVQRPARLVMTGPYAHSRNPMYVAWTAVLPGVALVMNTWWLLILLPAVVLVTHFKDVLPEEDRLDRRFGEVYRRYRDRVPRYL